MVQSQGILRARETLNKGRKLLAERQKLIRIADRSDHGWGVVAEYTADELADDSGDEKRIEKAEKAAEHRALKKRRKRGGIWGRPGGLGQVSQDILTLGYFVAAVKYPRILCCSK